MCIKLDMLLELLDLGGKREGKRGQTDRGSKLSDLGRTVSEKQPCAILAQSPFCF